MRTHDITIHRKANNVFVETRIAVQLTLSGVTDQTVSVQFTVSGTAGETIDYRLMSHSFVIPAGSASGRAVIEITNDLLEEPAETVILTLGAPTNATLGAGTQAIVTIQDNDSISNRYVPLIVR